MGLLIDIKKLDENEQEVTYFFCTDPIGNSGKVTINKKTGECFVIAEPEWDKESKLAIRVIRVLLIHWRKNEFPDVTYWAS